jgi:hypothetical protein
MLSFLESFWKQLCASLTCLFCKIEEPRTREGTDGQSRPVVHIGKDSLPVNERVNVTDLSGADCPSDQSQKYAQTRAPKTGSSDRESPDS